MKRTGAWAITKDNTHENTNKTTGPTKSEFWVLCEDGKEHETVVNHPDGIKFRLLDDDGELYFEGVQVENEDDGFGPLDDYGRAFGCTRLQYWDTTKEEWLTL